MRSLLESKHHIQRRPRDGRRKEARLLRIGSKNLYVQLTRLGMTPRKSLTMKFPPVPRRRLPFFVLGYFDGDGCVSLEAMNTARPRRLQTIFTSGSKEFLETLQYILAKQAGIKIQGLYKHGSSKNTFQLRFKTRDSIRLFLFMYPNSKAVSLALKRKYDMFITYFMRLGIRREDFPAILKKKGPVANEERIGLQNRHERVQLPPGPQKCAIVSSLPG